jgi:hypothetical protein
MRGSIPGVCHLAPRLLRPWHGPTTPSRTRRQGCGHSWQAWFRTKSRSASHSGSLSLAQWGPGPLQGPRSACSGTKRQCQYVAPGGGRRAVQT